MPVMAKNTVSRFKKYIVSRIYLEKAIRIGWKLELSQCDRNISGGWGNK